MIFIFIYKLNKLHMKNYLGNLCLLVCLMTFTLGGTCQHIDSVRMSPKNPTSNDSTIFLVYVGFPSSYCYDKIHGTQITNNTITNISQYCYGSYMVVCHNVDSVKVPKLSPGSYTFHYVLQSSLQVFGCSTYTPTDSLDFPFSINYPLGIDNHSIPNIFNITDFDNRKIIVRMSESKKSILFIYNLLGNKLFEISLNSIESEISVNLTKGLYLVKVSTEDGKSQTKKIIIKE